MGEAPAKSRIRVGVLAGGASAERQISLATGLQIAEHLPKDRFEAVLLDPLALMSANRALTPEQREHARRLVDGAAAEALLERDRELPLEFQRQIERAARSLAPATSAFAATGGDARIDVAFVALHGPWGEDGTIQGVLETLGIPHTGSGVLASALAMDKAMAKTVLTVAGLDVPRGTVLTRDEVERGDAAALARAAGVGLPAVVKPVANGSSFGVTIVESPAALRPALAEALRFDTRAIVEERVAGSELTCSVIGNDSPQALPVIEIVPKRAFFDYRAKYDSAASDEICPARIPPEVTARVQEAALRAHAALGCRGLSRTDFIWGGGRLATLEVNTMPGMTANSLLPKAAAVAGIEFGELLARLVGWALEDAGRRAR